MASRILGMGDVLTLVEKAQSTIDVAEAQKLQKKMMKNQFTLEDFLSQLQQIKKMGSMQDLLKMIPGVGKQLKQAPVDEKALGRTEAIIRSMTKKERQAPKLINGPRRKRIARGSGTRIQEVNQLLTQFDQMRKMMKKMGGMKNPKAMLQGMNPFG
jgi:signal recognition particle subunit SRP54